MHEIQLKIYKFLEDLKYSPYKIPQDVLEKFGRETQHALKRQFEREPRGFKPSMSNIGRPICQLLFEKAGYKAEISSNPIRNTYGDIIEDLVLFLLYASKVNVVSELGRTTALGLNGEYDLVIDLGDGPRVWDIKSASDWAFRNKYLDTSFKDFWEHDTFGYVGQLFLYAEGLGIKAGGWIISNKSSGEIAVLEVPKEQDEIRGQVLTDIRINIKNLSEHPKPLEEIRTFRKYSDELEFFKKAATGNRILSSNCGLCDFKHTCWPELKLEKQAKSKAKNVKMVYYTEYHEDV